MNKLYYDIKKQTKQKNTGWKKTKKKPPHTKAKNTGILFLVFTLTKLIQEQWKHTKNNRYRDSFIQKIVWGIILHVNSYHDVLFRNNYSHCLLLLFSCLYIIPILLLKYLSFFHLHVHDQSIYFCVDHIRGEGFGLVYGV